MLSYHHIQSHPLPFWKDWHVIHATRFHCDSDVNRNDFANRFLVTPAAVRGCNFSEISGRVLGKQEQYSVAPTGGQLLQFQWNSSELCHKAVSVTLEQLQNVTLV